MLVSVVVLTHLDRIDPILQNCLKSLMNSKEVELDVVVVSSRETPPQVPSSMKLINVPHDVRPQRAVHIGEEATNPKSSHIVFSNDDVIVSRYAIARMAHYIGRQPFLVNPTSNCDNGYMFIGSFDMMNKEGKMLPQKKFYTYEDVVGFEDLVMNYPLGYNVAVPYNILCNYFTMMSREVRREIGLFDEAYDLGWADTDYSIRALQKGCKLLTHMGAFVLHYGGVSAKTSSNDVTRKKDLEYFINKWGDLAKPYI